MTEAFIIFVAFVLYVGPIAIILQKAGYSPWWVLLAFIPVVNFIAFLMFALNDWPIEKELQHLRRTTTTAADSNAESTWELKRLAKRVGIIEQLSAPDGPDESTVQLLDTTGTNPEEFYSRTVHDIRLFLERATSDDDKAFATALLETCQKHDGRMADS